MSTEIRAGQRYEDNRFHYWIQDVSRGMIFFARYPKTGAGALRYAELCWCNESVFRAEIKLWGMDLVHEPEATP